MRDFHTCIPGGDEAKKKESFWWILGVQNWLYLMVIVTNYLYAGMDAKETDVVSMSPLTEVQTLAMRRMETYALRMMAFRPAMAVPTFGGDWDSYHERVKVAYDGSEVFPAVEMTWEQLAPALPRDENCARIPFIRLCSGFMATVMQRPEMLLKDEAEWPDITVRNKRNWCSDEEWKKIAVNLGELEVFTFLKSSEIFKIKGKPVLHNCMGISKNERLDDGRDILRLVMNLDVTNTILQTVFGDIRSLPYPGQWNAVSVVNDDHVMVHSQTDLSCAYYCFKLEQPWYRFFAFNGKLSGQDVAEIRPDLRDEPELYACSQVLCLGYASASGFMQYAHNVMAMSPPPKEISLPVKRQMERAVKRKSMGGSGHIASEKAVIEQADNDVLWEIFQDSFNMTEILPVEDAITLIGHQSPTLSALSDVYAVWGAQQAEDKTFHRSIVLEGLGYIKDGLTCSHVPTEKALMLTLSFTLHTLGKRSIHPKAFQILLGMWSQLVQLRQELGIVMDALWKAYKSFLRSVKSGAHKYDQGILLGERAQDALLTLCISSTFLVLDYRLMTDPVVTAGEANKTGCGVCQSARLTQGGKTCFSTSRWRTVSLMARTSC